MRGCSTGDQDENYDLQIQTWELQANRNPKHLLVLVSAARKMTVTAAAEAASALRKESIDFFLPPLR